MNSVHTYMCLVDFRYLYLGSQTSITMRLQLVVLSVQINVDLEFSKYLTIGCATFYRILREHFTLKRFTGTKESKNTP